MSMIKINIKEVNHSIDRIEIADNLVSRIVGLMFKSELKESNGLLIKPCNSIHTFFMFFNLDVLFISRSGEIVKIIRQMKPWRMSWIYFRSAQVLELKGGSLPLGVTQGMRVEVINV